MQLPFARVLSSRPDLLEVLKTTAPVVQHARYVRLNPAAIERAADTLAQQDVEPPAWNYDYHFFDGTERTISYLFLLDTLNFCFWGKPKWVIEYRGKKLDGYWALATSLKRAAEENPRVLEADFMANISPQELATILSGRGETESPLGIPLFAERWRGVRELGTALRDRWGGRAARLVEHAQGDAAKLAQMVAENFSSFNDIAVYRLPASLRAPKERRGNLNHDSAIASSHRSTARRPTHDVSSNDRLNEVHFFKRAQILAADLWGAFQGKQWGAFTNIDALTAFADYKLPQILRAWGILQYTPALARKIDQQIELAAGSAEEVEIRAATLWAVEFLREALATRGRALMSIQVDWILWEASQGRFKARRPYHRVRTIFY